MWGNKYPVMQPYVPPTQCPTLYRQNGNFAHPNVFPGLAWSNSEAERNMCYQKDWDASRKYNKSSEDFESVGDRLGESNRTAQDYECRNIIQSGHVDLTDKSEDKPQHYEFSVMKKRSYPMLAEGDNHLEGLLLSMPESNLNIMSPNPSSGRSKSTVEERELEKARKRLAPNEAAKRSRIRSKQICESLQARAEELSSETSKLNQDLSCYSEDCMKLRRKNRALLNERSQKCDLDEIAMLQAKNADPDQGESLSDYSFSDQSVDGSNSSFEVEANSL